MLDAVESRLFTTADFALDSGAVLPELAVAYETYGSLAPDGRNAVLAVHGYTSSHHAAGRYRKGGAPKGIAEDAAGWWDKLIGPGKAIDTDRLYVVSSNMLGSAHGTTGPASRNPRTGKPYGPDFPRHTVADTVRAQRLLLDHLGVKHLVAVAGPSYGGYQGFQWAVSYPDFMHGIVAAVSSPRHLRPPEATQALIADLAQDPNWNGGWYYDSGGVLPTLIKVRSNVLRSYGVADQLAARYPDPAAREQALADLARPWAEGFDANSLVVLRRALETFDTTPQFARIKAKVLFVISRTDQLFPPSIAPGVMQALAAAGVDARYFLLDSDLGHLASGQDAVKWAPVLAQFMSGLMAMEG